MSFQLDSDSELSEVLTALYYEPRGPSSLAQEQVVSIDPRVSAAENRFFLRGRLANSEKRTLFEHFLQRITFDALPECNFLTTGFHAIPWWNFMGIL